jgi:predicted hydrocarbon binding protein
MSMTLKSVSAPPAFIDAFTAMDTRIQAFFSDVRMSPEKGMMEIGGVRFRYSQSEGLATAFRDTLTDVYGEKGAEQILYKLGKSLGAIEGTTFHKRFGLVDPLEKLAAGPVYFAYSGWAFVEILPSSAPRPDEDYILTYNHPNSFEADAYINNRKRADHPICWINAGYSAGWCSSSFDVPLEAREITCTAMGDRSCTFIMTHRNRIIERVDRFRELLKSKRPEEVTTEELL